MSRELYLERQKMNGNSEENKCLGWCSKGCKSRNPNKRKREDETYCNLIFMENK